MEEGIRKSGIDIVGDVTWGTHLCQFYQAKEDLIDILVPYFKAGLENNEFCMWVTSEPLKVEDAKASLKQAVKNLDDYIKKGQIEILDAGQWYTKSGKFESDKVLQGWVPKEKQAIKRGFDGLRVTGNTVWLEKKDWRKFADYEATVDNAIGKHRMIAICSYSLDKCSASEIIDVVNHHQCALIRRGGQWELIESTERKRAEDRIRSVNRFMRVMNETSNLEELMNVILEQVIDMIPNADSGTFLMLNEAEGIFAFQAARGWDLELVKQIRIPVDRTILTQEPINEPTIVSGEEIEALDKRLYSPEIVKKFKEMRHPKSSIIVPVHIDGEVVGYFNINNKTAENAFDEEDLKVIEEIRDEITLVIKNIRLAEERENSLQELQQRNLELSALYAIASTVSGSLDLDAILGEALEKAMELMKMDAGGIFLREKQDLTLATYAGISPESAKAVDRMKLGEGVIGQVAQSGEPIVIQNLAEDPRVARQSIIEKEDLKTFIAVPLQSKDRIVGVFGLAHRVARLVTGEERQLLMAIGHQIGVVIENVKLFEQVKLAAEELEQRVKERTAELQIANEELETFVYSVSHHLKAPLRTLEGFSELLLEDRRDRLGEQGTAYLERIQTGALRMGKLIHGLLAYAQIGRSERTFLDVDMESLVKGCVKDLHSKIEAADARVEMPGDLPTVRGDPILLTPLVTNLLNNALTYCRDGVPPRIEVGWEERAEEHVFSIRDNGIGIEKRFWDRVFQPFKQLHLPEDYPGIGIGLAIARRVIEVHGGRIWVESKPDKGSTFYFTLPTRKTG